MHHDGIQFFALEGSHHGLLVMNHEYTDDGLPHPDGILRRCLVHGSPLHDAAGDRIGSVSVWTDITPRYEAESALRVSNVVINASAEMISVVDRDHTYHLVNEAWLRATGVSRSQIIGHRMNEGLRTVLSDARLQAVDDCLSQRRRQSVRDVVTHWQPELAAASARVAWRR